MPSFWAVSFFWPLFFFRVARMASRSSSRRGMSAMSSSRLAFWPAGPGAGQNGMNPFGI